MTDELTRAIRKVHDATHMRRGVNLDGLGMNRALRDAMRTLEGDSAWRRIMAGEESARAMARLVAGPIEDLRLTGVFEHASPLAPALKQIADNMAVYNARFRLPDLTNEARRLAEFRSGISETLERYGKQQASFWRAMESMRAPWLDMQEEMRSIRGMAALNGIGHAVRTMPPFRRQLIAALRVDMGDWRDPISWLPEVLEDPRARSESYVDLGFNPALTDFPGATFTEGLGVAGLHGARPGLCKAYGEPVSPSDDEEEEEGLSRTNKAHDWLLRLETQTRRFIDDEMTKAYGPDWPKRQLPGGLYDQWKEKQRKARRRGADEWPLVAYADFTDYMRVIGKRDNWRVFKPFFTRQEDVRESFQRLHPIRLDTMHARPITQDDELLLYVEVRRLVRVMASGD